MFFLIHQAKEQSKRRGEKKETKKETKTLIICFLLNYNSWADYDNSPE